MYCHNYFQLQQRWRVWFIVWDSHHQPAPVRHPRHARSVRETRRQERTGPQLRLLNKSDVNIS